MWARASACCMWPLLTRYERGSLMSTPGFQFSRNGKVADDDQPWSWTVRSLPFNTHCAGSNGSNSPDVDTNTLEEMFFMWETADDLQTLEFSLYQVVQFICGPVRSALSHLSSQRLTVFRMSTKI